MAATSRQQAVNQESMMRDGKKRGTRAAVIAILIVVCAGGAWFFFFRRPPDVRAALAARGDWMQLGMEGDAYERESLVARCLAIGRQHPNTVGGLLALQMAAARAPETEQGKEALGEFSRQVETADVVQLVQALRWGLPPWRGLAGAAPALLRRAREATDEPSAGRLAAAVCVATRPREGESPGTPFVEAADLIAEKFARSADIGHFCESLFTAGYSPPWAAQFEPHLRSIADRNQDRAVRCTARYALATLVHSAQSDRQEESRVLFEQFLEDFDGTHSYGFQFLEQQFCDWAKSQLSELRFRAVGMPAPEIAGVDLDGRPMTLSEHGGRVVLLTFWAAWCGPCMKLMLHESELAERLAGEPFAIIGVNSDSKHDVAKKAVEKHRVSWRSFQDKSGDRPAISDEWQIIGYPSVFLIDHHGTIRWRWIDCPTHEELGHKVEVLVDAARRNDSPEAMKSVVATLRAAGQTIAHENDRPRWSPSHVEERFVSRVYRDPRGVESRYVVFVPQGYDGTEPFPAIVFLHGAGTRGTDGLLPVREGYGLAQTIRQRGDDFDWIAIFPQAREEENWTAESPGGRRVLAILDEVQRDYRIDRDRIVLTGLSMGGQGTWSLAAAAPERWAAIVPICHGWNPAMADTLKEIPCWCFHGDADEVIPARQSREMIRAIRSAGGQPQYTELSGVGHDDCASRAYALPELWEWLGEQRRASR